MFSVECSGPCATGSIVMLAVLGDHVLLSPFDTLAVSLQIYSRYFIPRATGIYIVVQRCSSSCVTSVHF